MIVFHGTANIFDRFDPQLFGRCGNATNGALGVHVGSTTAIPRAFGVHVLVLEIERPVVEVVSLRVLMKLHDQAARDEDLGFDRYFQYRDIMLNKGVNVLGFSEINGKVEHAVVLDLDVITIVERVAGADTERLDELDQTIGSIPLNQRAEIGQSMAP